MSAPVIIIGAGGHAKVVVDALRRSGREILGLVDNDLEKVGETVLGVPVIGGDDAIEKYTPADVNLAIGLGPVRQRQALFSTFKKRGYAFANAIHPAAVVADSARIGEGAQIMAGAVIQPDAIIGDNVIINTRASVDHDCVIGDHVHIAPGATLAGGVWIGEGSMIGVGATLLENVRIGDNCVIAGGATVIGDVPANITVAGVPAKPMTSKEQDA